MTITKDAFKDMNLDKEEIATDIHLKNEGEHAAAGFSFMRHKQSFILASDYPEILQLD